MRHVFGERLKLLLAIKDKLMEGAALLVRKSIKSNDALLVCEGGHAQCERFQHRATNAELAATFCCLLKLALERWLINLPRQERRK